jgi:hypothetical protein
VPDRVISGQEVGDSNPTAPDQAHSRSPMDLHCDFAVYCSTWNLSNLSNDLNKGLQNPFPFASRPLEAELAGTMLYLRDQDELRVHPVGGVDPGKSGSKLSQPLRFLRWCATRQAKGAEAGSLVRLNGGVSDSILGAIRGIPAITVARLLKLG